MLMITNMTMWNICVLMLTSLMMVENVDSSFVPSSTSIPTFVTSMSYKSKSPFKSTTRLQANNSNNKNNGNDDDDDTNVDNPIISDLSNKFNSLFSSSIMNNNNKNNNQGENNKPIKDEATIQKERTNEILLSLGIDASASDPKIAYVDPDLSFDIAMAAMPVSFISFQISFK